MTTIAYRDGVMAADSQSTDEHGDYIVTKCMKIFRMESGAMLGTAGDDDAREIFHLLTEVEHEDDLPNIHELAEAETDFKGILVLPDETVWIIEVEYKEDYGQWTGSASQVLDEFCAVGTGAAIALGAMEMDAPPEDAIRAAARRDIHTSLPLQVMFLDNEDEIVPQMLNA